ncbi:MAG TPA: hypothetical protein VK688_03325 [Gemmatimonadales bacterium]|nr:hypothetical protein [Gemmatimonadales bacterium]
MAEARIKLSVGAVSFSGSGEPEWLAAQMERVLAEIPNLTTVRPAAVMPQAAGATGNGMPPAPAEVEGGFTTTLASYIKEKSGETNQNERFLATSDWLRRRGTSSLTAALIARTLGEHQQKRLGNPADCLNQNASKGYVEKVPANGTFFITPDGLRHLGHQV